MSEKTGTAARGGQIRAAGGLGVAGTARGEAVAWWLYRMGLGAVGGLLFVWYIPGVISIREALFLVALAIFAYLSAGRPWTGENLRPLGGILIAYLSFLGWMLLVIAFVSPDKGASLVEFWREWVAATACFPLGVLVVAVSRKLQAARWETHVLAVLWIPLALLVGIRDLDALLRWLQTGAVPWQSVRIVQNKHDMSILANLLFAVLLAEVLVRLRSGRQALPLQPWLMGALGGLVLLSNYLGMSRNGNLELVVILGCALLLFSADHWSTMKRHHLAAWFGVALALAGGFYVTSVVTDPRWALLVQSVKLGWDSEHHLGWLNPEHDEVPTLPDGRKADGSAFERTANLKEALKLVREHPWGWNIDKDGYHRLIFEKFRRGRQSGSSLFGLLDLAITVGLVGLGLWLAFLFQAARLGARGYARGGRPLAVLLLLVVVAFGFRSGIDSIIRDHFLEQFMFLVGMLATGAALEERAPTEA